MRSGIAAARIGSKTSMVSPPLCLALLTARSTQRNASDAEDLPSVRWTTPALTIRAMVLAPTSKGRASIASRSLTSSTAAALSGRFGIIARYSSPPEAGGEHLVRRDPGETDRDLGEQLIAREVTNRVVDQLESVDVDHGDVDHVAVTVGEPADGVLQFER